MEAFWDSLMADPVADKDLNHTYCLLVPCGDCYSVLCEHVSHDKDILPAVAGNIELGEVDGQYLEWSTGQQASHGGCTAGCFPKVQRSQTRMHCLASSVIPGQYARGRINPEVRSTP